MKSAIILLTITAVSCGQPSSPSPKLTYFTDGNRLDAAWSTLCRYGVVYGRESVSSDSLPRPRSHSEWFECDFLPANMPRAHVRLTGAATSDREVCALEIGPNRAGGPVTPSFVQDFFDSPRRDLVRALIGGLDPLREYSLAAMVDGVHVGVTQRQSFEGIWFHLILDGCDRLPTEPVADLGPRLILAHDSE